MSKMALEDYIKKPHEMSMIKYYNRCVMMYDYQKYFPPPIDNQNLGETLVAHKDYWKDVKNYEPSKHQLRSTILNGLPQRVIVYLDRIYRWSKKDTYQEPSDVSEAELLDALRSYETKKRQRQRVRDPTTKGIGL